MKKTKIMALLLSATLVFSGCGNMNNTAKGGLIGGGGGAALGAIIGGIAGHGKGAAIGAAVGAAVGTGAGVLIGKKMDKAAEEAAKAEAEAKAAEDAMKEDDQITGQISLEDILSEFEGNTEEEPVKEGADAENASEVKQEDMADSTGDIIKGDTMETNKKTTPILPPDIQRMIDEIEGVIPPE